MFLLWYSDGDSAVDHVLPRGLCHDEIWNLVVAHSHCNGQKLDYVVTTFY